MRTILAIDGGGVRGVIPARIVVELEQELDCPISDAFDMVAGVSTGGIIACGLAARRLRNGAKLRAEDMLRFYKEDAPSIFRRGRFRTLDLFRPRYKAESLKAALEKRMPGAMLSDTDTELLVTAYAVDRGSAMEFKTARAKNNPEFNFSLASVAMASSLAPTYFGSRPISSADGSRVIECIDGGVARNNVATLALAHARTMWPGEKVFILSLGTGVRQSSPLGGAGRARNWGGLKWAPRVIETFMDAGSDFVVTEMRALADSWHRINPPIDNGLQAMDNASSENIAALMRLAEKTWDQHGGELFGKTLPVVRDSLLRRRQMGAMRGDKN